METKNLADLYNLEPIPWSRALAALETGNQRNETSFLATTRPDGRPHLAGVGAVWDNGKVYFVSGDGTRKSKNVAENPACSMAISLPGIDLVIEGEAQRVTDDETLHRLAKRYAEGGWPARVEDGAFTYDYSAPSAGPPPWNLYAIAPVTIYGVLAAEPGGATRWRFDGEDAKG
jgi:nitroimidazol reductase NimA-like FMN-containing flavoprotein (pyridoxamine 5'-phosphate oxidase superfamily)